MQKSWSSDSGALTHKDNSKPFPAPLRLFSLSRLLRAETSACSVSTRRSLSSTFRHAFCPEGKKDQLWSGKIQLQGPTPLLITHLQLRLQRVIHVVYFVNLSQKAVRGEEPWAGKRRRETWGVGRAGAWLWQGISPLSVLRFDKVGLKKLPRLF